MDAGVRSHKRAVQGLATRVLYLEPAGAEICRSTNFSTVRGWGPSREAICSSKESWF